MISPSSATIWFSGVNLWHARRVGRRRRIGHLPSLSCRFPSLKHYYFLTEPLLQFPRWFSDTVFVFDQMRSLSWGELCLALTSSRSLFLRTSSIRRRVCWRAGLFFFCCFNSPEAHLFLYLLRCRLQMNCSPHTPRKKRQQLISQFRARFHSKTKRGEY